VLSTDNDGIPTAKAKLSQNRKLFETARCQYAEFDRSDELSQLFPALQKLSENYTLETYAR
jgi:hypothetical protein